MDAILAVSHAVDTLASALEHNELLENNVIDELKLTISSAVRSHLKIPVTKTSGQGGVEHLASSASPTHCCWRQMAWRHSTWLASSTSVQPLIWEQSLALQALPWRPLRVVTLVGAGHDL